MHKIYKQTSKQKSKFYPKTGQKEISKQEVAMRIKGDVRRVTTAAAGHPVALVTVRGQRKMTERQPVGI